MTTRRAVLASIILFVIIGTACTAPSASAPSATTTPPAATSTPSPSTTATPAATASTTPTATPSATASPFVSPTNLKLAGRLPDISTPVPPGEGELGRLTISWEMPSAAPAPRGFRIYTKDCDGTVKAALDVPAADHQYGPIHACRPTGNLGVTALSSSGESPIAWVR